MQRYKEFDYLSTHFILFNYGNINTATSKPYGAIYYNANMRFAWHPQEHPTFLRERRVHQDRSENSWSAFQRIGDSSVLEQFCVNIGPVPNNSHSHETPKSFARYARYSTLNVLLSKLCFRVFMFP